GHEHLYHPSMLGMVDTIARNIEDRLLIQQRNPQMILSLSTQPSKHDEALLAVDQHGQIIGTNREARELLLLENIIDKAIYLEELFSNTEPLFQHQQTTTQSIPLHMKGSEEKQLSAPFHMQRDRYERERRKAIIRFHHTEHDSPKNFCNRPINEQETDTYNEPMFT